MEFGKLQNIDLVNFSLPTEENYFFNSEKNNDSQIQINLGLTGWSMPKWKGLIYPKNSTPAAFGRLYSQLFQTIEFNTTYYQVPKIDLINKWYNQKDSDFIFCPKIYQGISLSNNLGVGSSLLHDFVFKIIELKEKLGSLFMQLPSHFSSKKIKFLQQFCAYWQGNVPLAIELRHESFFEKSIKNEIGQLFADSNISWLITDVAGRRDVCHQNITTPTVMIRFVANHHPSDYERINQWLNRFKIWQQNGVRQVYFFLHTPENNNPFELCSYLAEQWHAKTSLIIKHPNITTIQSTLF